MKVLLLVTGFILVFSTKSLAQLDDKEKAFELEEETVQIHDAEGEQKAAQQEAQRAEKLEREQRMQLDRLRSQKASILKQSEAQIAVDKNRILVAEAKRKAYQKEMVVLNSQIKTLQDQVAKVEAHARTDEGAVRDDKATLEKSRHDKGDLANRKTKAQLFEAKATQDIRQMKIEYARLKMETAELEGHLHLVEESAAKRGAERDRLARDIAAMKQRKAAADQAIRDRDGSH